MTRLTAPHLALIVTSDLSLIFFRGQLRHLIASGFRVTCISSPGPAQQLARAEGAAVLSLPMARRIAPLQDILSLLRLTLLLSRLRPEIVNAGTPKAGLLGGLAALLARVPRRIYTLHGLRLETTRNPQRLMLTLTERLACACAHRVRAVSPSLRKRALALRLANPAKIHVIGPGTANGLDLNSFTCTPVRRLQSAHLRLQHHLPADALILGFVGRITRDKGIHELEAACIELLHTHSNLRLLLIGDFELSSPSDYALRDRLLANPHIVHIPPVPDLAPYYLLLDLLLFPTYREGFGNVSIEAQAMGVPVITTAATGSQDSVQHGITGLIVPVADAPALQRAAAKLLANPALRARMGQAGRVWVAETFAAPALWQLIAADYTAMLGHPVPTLYQRCGKRLFDLLVASTALILLAPLLLALALIVRVALGSPVFFRQPRPGRHGCPFTLVKFRTMTDRRDADGHLLPDRDRLTRFGRLLRSTSLDELPELFNVLRGHMSLVGPRPLLTEYLSLYSPQQQRRHLVRPGITGWAQVNGRNAISWQRKLAFDTDYAAHPTFAWDLRILILTVLQVLRRTGIAAAGHDTTPRFQGTPQGSEHV